MVSAAGCQLQADAKCCPTGGARAASALRLYRIVMTGLRSQALPRGRRLKHTRDFSRLRTDGMRLACGCLILNWQIATGSQQSRLGVVTPRFLGGAVVRSRCRRLLREVFRRHQDKLNKKVDVVLVARPSLTKQDYASVERDYLKALRLAKLIDG